MKYFDDYVEAYKDDKIVLLRPACGGAAIDAYWTLLELIYREETEIKPTERAEEKPKPKRQPKRGEQTE